MSMISDKMIGEYKGYNMYENETGIYYFSDLIGGLFIQQAFDNIQDMKDYIDTKEDIT